MKLSNFLYTRSAFVVALLSAILTFSFVYFVFIDAAACFEVDGAFMRTLGTTFGFSKTDVMQFFSARDTVMLGCYREFNVIWDNFFVVLYGIMYISWLSYLLKPRASKFSWLNLFPLVLVLFDFLENFMLVRMIDSYLLSGDVNASAAQWAGLFSMAKWTCAGFTFTLLLVGIGVQITNRLKEGDAQLDLS